MGKIIAFITEATRTDAKAEDDLGQMIVCMSDSGESCQELFPRARFHFKKLKRHLIMHWLRLDASKVDNVSLHVRIST